MPASPRPSLGPGSGRNCYTPLKVSWAQKKKVIKSELATSPLPSRGPKKGRDGYIIPVMPGVLRKGDKTKKSCPTASPAPYRVSKNGRTGYINPGWGGTTRDKLRIGCITRTLSGAQNRAELVRHPRVLRVPKKRKWHASGRWQMASRGSL